MNECFGKVSLETTALAPIASILTRTNYIASYQGQSMNINAQKREPYITMKDGWKLHLLNPTSEQIRIGDIAWHLSRTCRYNAHMEDWYSNAEHSVLGTRQASSLRVAQYFLLHDAGEYAFGDLTSPVKRLVPAFKKNIDDFQFFLWHHFCGDVPSIEIIEEVDLIDKRLTATEMKYLRHQPDSDMGPYKPYDGDIFYNYDWQEARVMFMDEFHKLFPV